MSKKITIPKIKKKLSDFVKDESGNFPRSKAAIVGPVATVAAIVIAKDLVASAYTAHKSHSSHRSHISHSSNSNDSHVSHSSHSSHASHSSASQLTPNHTSHSSGQASGFSHTADTLFAEGRNAGNN